MTRRMVLGCSATFAGAFDFGFMTLAAPALDRELALGAAYPWIFGAGSLAYGASVMPAGDLAARVAPHRLLAAGLLLAAVGAAVVASAPGAQTALAGRALFGLGGGIAAAPALALLAAIEPPALRRAAFARLGASVTLGFTSGVLLAALVDPWRSVLLAFAAALATLAAAARNPHPPSQRGQAPLAPNPRPPSQRGQAPLAGRRTPQAPAETGQAPLAANPRPPSERGQAPLAPNPQRPSQRGQAPLGARGGAGQGGRWFGAATVAATVALALGPAAPVLAVVVGAGALGLARRGWRRAAPWLPPARAALVALCVAGAATTASGVGAIVLLGRELSPSDGLVLAAFGVALPPATALARRGARAVGAAGSAGIGLALQAAGIALLGPAVDRPLALAPLLVVFGAGHVIANAGTADAVTALAGPRAAQAGGLLITVQFTGGGAGALLVLAAADAAGPPAALTVAAGIAAAGALVLLPLRAALRPAPAR